MADKANKALQAIGSLELAKWEVEFPVSIPWSVEREMRDLTDLWREAGGGRRCKFHNL